jgi:hypothetical protein
MILGSPGHRRWQSKQHSVVLGVNRQRFWHVTHAFLT